jgi:hypothetical protein
MQQEADTLELPNEICEIIIQWLCRTSHSVRIPERSVMFVCWQWFEYTCRTLSDMGALATHKEAMLDYITLRGIDGLRITIVEPTSRMLHLPKNVRALAIRTRDVRYITLYRTFGMEDLSISSSGLRCGLVYGELPYSLKSVKLENVAFANDSEDDAARIIENSSKLRSLILRDVELPLHLSLMRCLGNLRVLKIPDVEVDDDGIRAIPLMTRLIKLDISVSWENNETIRFPDSLQTLKVNGYADLDLSGCASLTKLSLNKSDVLLANMLAEACKLPALQNLRIARGDIDIGSRVILSLIPESTGIDIDTCSQDLFQLASMTNLRRLHASVDTRDNTRWLPFITSLERLSLELRGAAKVPVESLVLMSRLKVLNITTGGVQRETDEIERIFEMHWLQELSICHGGGLYSVSLQDVHMMTNLKKLRLNLVGLPIGKAKSISKVTTLEYLDIGHVIETKRECIYVLRELPRLRKLILRDNAKRIFDLPDYCETCECFV